MVLINSIFAPVAVLMALVPAVFGAALPDSTHGLQTRDGSLSKRATHDTSTWDKYHEVNGGFARQGLCMIYMDPTPRDGKWACGKYCNNENTRICTSPITSAEIEHGHPAAINRNPDGARWYMGNCQCDTSTVDAFATAVVDFTAQGLDIAFKALPYLTCTTFLTLSKEVIVYGSWLIPGGGQVASAARAAAKAVKMATKTDGGQSKFESAVKNTCGGLLTEELVQKLFVDFGKLNEAPDYWVEEFSDDQLAENLAGAPECKSISNPRVNPQVCI